MRQAVRHKFYVKKSPFAKYVEVINANPTKKHFLNTTIVNLRYMLSEKPRTFPLFSPFLSTARLHMSIHHAHYRMAAWRLPLPTHHDDGVMVSLSE